MALDPTDSSEEANGDSNRQPLLCGKHFKSAYYDLFVRKIIVTAQYIYILNADFERIKRL